jgi:signal transduction histidine kinase
LGLPLCYAVVKQHAGTIEVDSVPGQGSAFTVRLNLSLD